MRHLIPGVLSLKMTESTWRIVKTSGGFGVQQRVGGPKVTKLTIVKPAEQPESSPEARAPVREDD
jgi:hypothetical protein